MRVAAFQSLISFTVYALLSTSVVVAIPVPGDDADFPISKRLADVNSMPSSIFGRGRGARSRPLVKGPAARPKSSKGPGKKQATTAACSLAKRPKVGQRDLIDDALYGRTGSTGKTEDDNTTLAELDPKHEHLVEKGPERTSSDNLGQGSFGQVYLDPEDAKRVIKHIESDLEPGALMQLTPGALRREIKYLEMAGQYRNYQYTVTAPGSDTLKEAWIWMVRIEGESFKSLGFSSSGVETLPVPMAFPRGSPQRKVFLNTVIDMAVAREYEYYQVTQNLRQMDPNTGNIMIKFKPGSTTYEIESVDFVDWARGRTVRSECPDSKEDIRARIEPYFARLFGK